MTKRRTAGSRLVRTAIAMAVRDYGPLARHRSVAERDAAAGRRLAATLGELRGVYTKLGQHLGYRVDWFSDEFRAPLGELVDRAPPVPFRRVRRQLEAALGSLAAFKWIDPEPLGTASIAQVHRAALRDGRVVAVKVRHEELTPARIERDLTTLRRGLRWFRPRLDRARSAALIDELANALRAEIDFEAEARTAVAIGHDLAGVAHVVVPGVHWELTSKSVLTLDFVPSIRLDDRAAVAAAGVDPARALEIVSDAYGRQVFGHGLFHADPHPGNVQLVDESHPAAPPGETRPRVLFVDFGLAQQLPVPLRRALQSGLKALLKRDVGGVLDALEGVGAIVPGRREDAERALRGALEAGASEALGADAAGIGALRELGKRLVRESGAFLPPAELLLFARTLAYVFDLAERIAPGSDPMRRLVPHVLGFVVEPIADES